MELKHIALDQLHVSKLNMRDGKKAPDITDILPSIRARGILQPLLVRPNTEGFEIVAGRRRYYSAKAVEAEKGSFDPVPCAVMDASDDAAALEASLIENAARLDPDEMSQYETFARLIQQGRSIEEIAITFGFTERGVKQRLALGNLIPKIRELYRAEEIDIASLQSLTMATASQQREWLKLLGDNIAPYGHRLKSWLLGGQLIHPSTALYPVGSYTGHYRADLFGEEAYIGEPEQFWQLQNAAIEERKAKYLSNGWAEVIRLETGERFDQWDHERVTKPNGGKVYIAVATNGEVEFFEGWLPRKAVRSKAASKTDEKSEPARPAMTQGMQNYLELHRHAAVRLALLGNPATAYRLLVAHAVASSGNWNVRTEAQRSHSNAIKASIEQGDAQKAFEAEREKIEKLLDLGRDVAGDHRTVQVFARLLAMKDAQVQRIAAFAMADTLACGSTTVEAAGQLLEVDPSAQWQADDCFFELLRDKAVLNAMLAQVAGKDVAKANADAKAVTLKQIIRDALAGKNGRKKAERWLPNWMAFPFSGYGKGSSKLAEDAADAKKLLRK